MLRYTNIFYMSNLFLFLLQLDPNWKSTVSEKPMTQLQEELFVGELIDAPPPAYTSTQPLPIYDPERYERPMDTMMKKDSQSHGKDKKATSDLSYCKNVIVGSVCLYCL
jgi:hypothetical protein